MDMADKVIWITGASSGIGEALCYELAQKGAKLILSSRNETALQRVRSDCHDPEKHVIVPIDLEKYADLPVKALNVWEEHGPIDVLINNAGLTHRFFVAESNLALDQKIMDINFMGTIALTRPILQKMLARNMGEIAVVSSLLGLLAMQSRSTYAASKHALKGYFESLRNELYGTPIKIMLIYPGYIKTAIAKHALQADGQPTGKMDNAHINGIPAEVCAQKIVHGLEAGRPQVIISDWREHFGVTLSRLCPGLFRWLSPRIGL